MKSLSSCRLFRCRSEILYTRSYTTSIPYNPLLSPSKSSVAIGPFLTSSRVLPSVLPPPKSMSKPVELPECAVCGQKAKLRCGRRRQVLFCGAEHQKMVRSVHLLPLDAFNQLSDDTVFPLQIWPTYKWLCGKKSDVFCYPPLAPEEAEVFRTVERIARLWTAGQLYSEYTHKSLKNIEEMSAACGKRVRSSFLSSSSLPLPVHRISARDTLQDLVEYLREPYTDPTLLDDAYIPRSVAFREGLFRFFTDNVTGVPPAPWTSTANLHHILMVAFSQGTLPTGDHLHFLTRTLAPFLRQALIFFTLVFHHMGTPEHNVGLAFFRLQCEGDRVPMKDDQGEGGIIDQILVMVRNEAMRQNSVKAGKKKIYTFEGVDIVL